ncbi:MAG: TIGR03435 family protein [Acidobacteriia bacterium]|nr:TIGR03435 family protein [Terriglobia bacterium]
MTKTLALAAMLILSAMHGHCQDLAKPLAFEVASITPCPPGTPAPPTEHAGIAEFTSPGGRFRASATTVKFLLEWAYGIQPSQHSDGPAWLGTDRYDIVAKAEGNASDPQIKRMVQTLLAERFQLKLHRESKELSAYVISVGKTAPKLFPPKDDETHALRVAPQMGPNQKPVSYRVIATRYTLTQLTDIFARQMDSLVVNQTGLNGEFDFTLDLTPDEERPNPVDPTILMTAMREQLGLTMKSQKIPVDFLVIDSAEKVVAGN